MRLPSYHGLPRPKTHLIARTPPAAPQVAAKEAAAAAHRSRKAELLAQMHAEVAAYDEAIRQSKIKARTEKAAMLEDLKKVRAAVPRMAGGAWVAVTAVVAYVLISVINDMPPFHHPSSFAHCTGRTRLPIVSGHAD